MRRAWSVICAAVLALACVGFSSPRVAVAPFVDRAGTGLANIGPGLGEMLGQRLAAAGLFVIPPAALQAWLSQTGGGVYPTGIIPTPDTQAWRTASLALGADVLILPSVEKFYTSTIAFTLFLFTVRGASVQTDLHAEVVHLATGAVQSVTAHGEASGAASVEVHLHFPFDVCSGGFRTSKGVYFDGETVPIGYRDPAPPNTYYITIHSSASPIPNWASATASSTGANPCVTWTWNQALLPHAGPGEYVAILYRVPSPVPIATQTFTISAAAAVELVVGSASFASAPWGEALNQALDSLAAKLLSLVR